MTNPRQSPASDADDESELSDLATRLRAELVRLRKAAPGSVSVSKLRDEAPLLWDRAVERYPSWSSLSDVPLRQLLREAAHLMEPSARGEAARDLFGLWEQTYGMSFERRRERAAERFNVSVSHFRQTSGLEAAVLDELANRLHQILTAATSDEKEAIERPRVKRTAYDQLIIGGLTARTPGRLLLRGEPGTGKTDIISAARKRAGLRVVRIRAQSLASAQEDVLDFLEARGTDTHALGWESARAKFRSHLRGLSNKHLLVIDNATDIDLVRDLIVESTPAHIVITARRRHSLEGFSEVEVDDFTAQEATEFCEINGYPASETTAEVIEALGRRPLALAQALAFLDASGSITLQQLASAMTIAPAATLDAAARSVQARDNLAGIYRAILDEMFATWTNKVVLDFALWLSDGAALHPDFITSVIGRFLPDTTTPEIDIEAAFFALLNAALIRPVDPNDEETSRRGSYEFSPLTFEILSELEAKAIAPVLTHLIRVLKSERAIPLPMDVADCVPNDPRLRPLNFLRNEMEAVMGAMATDTRLLDFGQPVLCLGEMLWLAIGPHPTSDRGVLFRIHPRGVTMWADGQRLDLTPSTSVAQRLRGAADAFYEATWHLYPIGPPPASYEEADPGSAEPEAAGEP